MDERKDLILYGATGFTGRLVAAYLCERYGAADALRWCIAGRSVAKLEALRAELTSLDPTAAGLPIVLADAAEPATLRSMARQARVVISTVGPYGRYGSDLVAACVEEGADYCDLTGEVPWIRAMIDAHHHRAVEQGRRVVHCCGFDSIPSDLGVYLLQQAARERFGQPLPRVRLLISAMKGGFSGGTVASMMDMAADARDPAVRRLLADPYALIPAGAARGDDGADQTDLRWDEGLGRWTGPFVMAAINTRVVRRSNALLADEGYGADFSYQEASLLPRGARGWWIGQVTRLGLGAMMLAASLPGGARLLTSTVLPAPGRGPSPEQIESGYFAARILAEGEDVSGRACRLELRVKGVRDPGYGATCRMLAESALCLLQDRRRLPQRFGVLTPASAMGRALAERLESAGLSFEVVETPGASSPLSG
jgi:short subunit dehydrogenase-like uncharacterized protein